MIVVPVPGSFPITVSRAQVRAMPPTKGMAVRLAPGKAEDRKAGNARRSANDVKSVRNIVGAGISKVY